MGAQSETEMVSEEKDKIKQQSSECILSRASRSSSNEWHDLGVRKEEREGGTEARKKRKK